MDVRERVLARTQVEANAHNEEKAALLKARKEAAKELNKQTSAVGAVVSALAEGKVPTKAQNEKADVAERQIVLLRRQLTKINTRALSLTEALAKLDDPKEIDRRVKLASELLSGVENPEKLLSGTQAARQILLAAKKPLHVTAITATMLETGVVALEGKTPAQTVSAYLAKAAAKGDVFVRVDRGVFDLRERVEQTESVEQPA